MNVLDQLAEQRIREAQESGDLDDLPGAGKPLDLDDDSMIPEHLRMAYRVLKNANCVPPELLQRQEIRSLEDLIEALYDESGAEADERRTEAERRLAVLQARLETGAGARSLLTAEARYRDRLLDRFQHQSDLDPEDPSAGA